VAVQSGSGVKPVTVKTAGEASLADALAGVTTPVSQVRETVTEAALSGTKSLRTENVSTLRVLVIVQLALPPSTIATLAQLASSAV